MRVHCKIGEIEIEVIGPDPVAVSQLFTMALDGAFPRLLPDGQSDSPTISDLPPVKDFRVASTHRLPDKERSGAGSSSAAGTAADPAERVAAPAVRSEPPPAAPGPTLGERLRAELNDEEAKQLGTIEGYLKIRGPAGLATICAETKLHHKRVARLLTYSTIIEQNKTGAWQIRGREGSS